MAEHKWVTGAISTMSGVMGPGPYNWIRGPSCMHLRWWDMMPPPKAYHSISISKACSWQFHQNKPAMVWANYYNSSTWIKDISAGFPYFSPPIGGNSQLPGTGPYKFAQNGGCPMSRVSKITGSPSPRDLFQGWPRSGDKIRGKRQRCFHPLLLR